MSLRHTEAQYLRYDPFSGDRDVDIRFRKRAIVTTRKLHPCTAGNMLGKPHDIPVGTRAWKESAKVEGMVESCFCCLDCLDKFVEADGFCWICDQYHKEAIRS